MDNNDGTEDGRSKGGRVRAEKLTSERRREIAAKGAKARWRGGAKPVKATHDGVIKIGDIELDCANLPDGRRVISEATMMAALKRGYSGYYSKRDRDADPGTAVLPRYLSPAALKPFVPRELSDLQLIAYIPKDGLSVSKGVDADIVPQICETWLRAREAGKLKGPQLITAAKAEIIVRGLARVGIAALIDEATGYQYDRAKTALADILEKYISKQLARYASIFPTEFYQHIFRLRGWNGDPLSGKRPQVVGRWTTDIVYARLAPGVLQKLKEITPRGADGRLTHKLFQRLTAEPGIRALRDHLASVCTILALSGSWDQFWDNLDRRHPKFNTTLMLPFPDEDTD